MGCFLILTEQDLVNALALSMGSGAAQRFVAQLRENGLYRDLLTDATGTRSDLIDRFTSAYLAELYIQESHALSEEQVAATAAAWWTSGASGVRVRTRTTIGAWR